MKLAILTLGLVTSASAFAAPSYNCIDLNGKDKPVMIEIAQDGKSVQFLNNTSPVEKVTLAKDIQAPSGFTAFEGTAACPQTGEFTCHSITLVQLDISRELLSGAMQGDVIYEGNMLRCDMLLK